MDVNVAAPILPSKSGEVVDNENLNITKKLRGVRLVKWVAQSASALNQMQHENAEAFRNVGFARQHQTLHFLRVLAPLMAQLQTQ